MGQRTFNLISRCISTCSREQLRFGPTLNAGGGLTLEFQLELSSFPHHHQLHFFILSLCCAAAMSHLTNPLATPSQLYNHVHFSALPQDLQEIIFTATQCLTQAAGLLLELPQAVTAQASVVLARYWLIDSPMSHEFAVRYTCCSHLLCIVANCHRMSPPR